MSYLIIYTFDYTMEIKPELTTKDKDKAEHGYLCIIDMELKQFYVENDVWQKIPER